MNIPEIEFVAWPKIPRLNRDIIITEKIDGTNASVLVTEDGQVFAGSRTRWITPETDNYGFARWVQDNSAELLKLGPGHHFGEWWGAGIQRRYDQTEKHFSLFNVKRWTELPPPACCRMVPVLYAGLFDEIAIRAALYRLGIKGSTAAPGFMKPEGLIVFHTAAQQAFKVTIENDDQPKGDIRS